jgi:hypothetical protein
MIDSRWYRQTTARAERMIALVREVEEEKKDEG